MGIHDCYRNFVATKVTKNAFATFSTDEDGNPTGIKMKPISPATDFSYDFQDLDFHKVN
jgi:hypothetical protein